MEYEITLLECEVNEPEVGQLTNKGFIDAIEYGNLRIGPIQWGLSDVKFVKPFLVPINLMGPSLVPLYAYRPANIEYNQYEESYKKYEADWYQNEILRSEAKLPIYECFEGKLREICANMTMRGLKSYELDSSDFYVKDNVCYFFDAHTIPVPVTQVFTPEVPLVTEFQVFMQEELGLTDSKYEKLALYLFNLKNQ